MHLMSLSIEGFYFVGKDKAFDVTTQRLFFHQQLPSLFERKHGFKLFSRAFWDEDPLQSPTATKRGRVDAVDVFGKSYRVQLPAPGKGTSAYLHFHSRIGRKMNRFQMLAFHKGILTDFSDLHTTIRGSVIDHYGYRVFLIGSATRVLEQGVAVAFAKAIVVPFKQHAVLGQVIEAIGWFRPERKRVQLLASGKGIDANALNAA
jgi:hypothetical protein